MTTAASSSTTHPSVVGKGAAIGAVLAVVINIIVFVIFNAGDPLQVVMQGDTEASDLPIGAVIAASIFPLIIGAIGLVVLERLRPNGLRIWTILVAVLVVLSMAGPIGLDVDSTSKLALAIMHVVVGAAAVVGQTVARGNRS